MDWSGGHERHVFVVDSDPRWGSTIESQLESNVEVDVVTTVDGVLPRLPGATCVVLGEVPAEASLAGLIADVRESANELPIVVCPRTDDGSVAASVATVPSSRYVPRRAGNETVAARIDDAIEWNDRRRDYRFATTVLQSTFDELPYHLYVKDAEGRYRLMTDVPDVPDPEDVIGKTEIEAFGDEEAYRRTYRDDLEVIESGEPIVARERHLETDVAEYWVEETKIPWRGEDGEIRGLVGLSLDVNDRKEIEGEYERRRTLHERITRYIAHDLRNPLTLARGSLEFARESGDPESFESIEVALDRIEAVVENMRIVIGDEGSRTWDDLAPARLAEAITEAWDTVDTVDATLENDVPERATILAHESPLQEVFENLFRNAVEHGGSDVTVRVRTLTDGFAVEDTGVGIPPDFDIMEYGVTTGSTGSGLGLAIVTEIANTYGWTVAASEGDDGGARFEVRNCQLVSRPHESRTPGEERRIEASQDFGDARPAGDARELPGMGAWQISGGGNNIWRETHQHHFAYARVDGDARITARLAALERIEEYTKAGVMIRLGLEEDAPYAFIGKTSDHGSEVVWRTTPGGHATSAQFDDSTDLPIWYRLERVGDDLTSSLSTDGERWTPIDQRRVEGSHPVFAGLAVCSHDSDNLTEARFEAVDVTTLR